MSPKAIWAIVAMLFLFSTSLAYAQEAAPAPAPADAGKPRLVVLDLRADGVPEKVARSLTDLLAMELEKLNKYDVITRDSLRAVLSIEQQKQLLGAEEGDDQIGKVGEALNAPYLLKGSIGQVGATYVVNLQIINTRSLKVERRTNQNLVGKRDELIGSLRTAVIAIALEDKGIESDITQDLLADLHIAEKPKTAFFNFRVGYEIPLGPTKDSSDLLYFRPDYFNFIIDAEYHVLPFMGVMFSTGFATTLGAQFAMQTKQQIEIEKPVAGDDPVTQGFGPEVRTSQVDFTAMKIPFDIAIKFRPSKGRFLPYAFTGFGVSYHMYQFDNEDSQFLTKTQTGNDTYAACEAPYQPGTLDPNNCVLKLSLKSQEDRSFLALDYILGAGFDYLLTENVGISLEARYNMNYSFSGARDLDAIFSNEDNPTAYNGTDNNGNAATLQNIYQDTIPIRKLHHGLIISAGFLAYF